MIHRVVSFFFWKISDIPLGLGFYFIHSTLIYFIVYPSTC